MSHIFGEYFLADDGVCVSCDLDHAGDGDASTLSHPPAPMAKENLDLEEVDRVDEGITVVSVAEAIGGDLRFGVDGVAADSWLLSFPARRNASAKVAGRIQVTRSRPR
jgi:hypothetical protein